jgi:aryl-phospho-beta-D-glucosidase BglC (GH1 family)
MFGLLNFGGNSFDNSGERMATPMWASNQTNVDRTNDIIKTIAGMFKDDTANVPIIAPLNELSILVLWLFGWLALLTVP